MNWEPFVVSPEGSRAPQPRGLNTPEGLGDRLRTAAFAELQAREAFGWAAARFEEAPAALRGAWLRLAAEEDKHLGWLLARMAELGVDPSGRPVSDRLWVSLVRCASAGEFAAFMATAEERGRVAEESFHRSLAGRDPVTSDIFRRIAEEEVAHIALQNASARGERE